MPNPSEPETRLRAGEPPAVCEPAAPAFQRKLGLFDTTMLVAGSMIGSGIFVVSASIARDVGASGWLIVIWIVSGVMTIIGALSYAELASMYPHAGGQYVFLREAYGPLWAFLYGWTAFLVIQAGFIAAVAVIFARYLGVLIAAAPAGWWWMRWLDTDCTLLRVPLDIDLGVPVPWMSGTVTFFKRDAFTISTGQFVAVGLIVFLTALNLLGVGMGRWVQNIFTVAKTLGLVGLIFVGLTFAADPVAITENRENLWLGITETEQFAVVSKFAPVMPVAVVLVLCGAMVGALFSSDAWNNVTFVAGEVKNPHRTLPWGLFLGTGAVVVLYLLANFAYLASLPLKGDPEEIARLQRIIERNPESRAILEPDIARFGGIDDAPKDRVATAVIERVSPLWGVPVMAAVIMISTFGCNNGLILMGPRMYYAMANDGLFFRSVGRLNQWGVPAAGLLLQMLWSIVLVFSGSYDELLDYIIFGALLFYILTVLAVFVLRRRRPDLERPYRALGYPVVPALYIVLCAVIALGLLVVKPVFSWPSFVIVLVGIPVYLLWRGAERPVSA
jgi:APA family basic amino acid/polyamine antiporter